MKSGITLIKADRVVSWKLPEVPATMKKKLATAAPTNDAPTIRDILDGGANPSVVIEPLAPSSTPGQRGTVLLVPNGQDYYFALVYIGGEEGSLTVSLPPVQGILVMDLPEGMFTDPAAINKAIKGGTGGGPPDNVGPSTPH
jgi:hypothetical protein